MLTHTIPADLPPEVSLVLGHGDSEEGRHLELGHNLPLQLGVVLGGVLQPLGMDLQGRIHLASKLQSTYVG